MNSQPVAVTEVNSWRYKNQANSLTDPKATLDRFVKIQNIEAKIRLIDAKNLAQSCKAIITTADRLEKRELDKPLMESGILCKTRQRVAGAATKILEDLLSRREEKADNAKHKEKIMSCVWAAIAYGRIGNLGENLQDFGNAITLWNVLESITQDAEIIDTSKRERIHCYGKIAELLEKAAQNKPLTTLPMYRPGLLENCHKCGGECNVQIGGQMQGPNFDYAWPMNETALKIESVNYYLMAANNSRIMSSGKNYLFFMEKAMLAFPTRLEDYLVLLAAGRHGPRTKIVPQKIPNKLKEIRGLLPVEVDGDKDPSNAQNTAHLWRLYAAVAMEITCHGRGLYEAEKWEMRRTLDEIFYSNNATGKPGANVPEHFARRIKIYTKKKKIEERQARALHEIAAMLVEN